MNLGFTEEQLMLQQTARKFFDREVPTDLVKRLQENTSIGHCKTLWNKMAEVGWLGLFIPEEYNGAGTSLLELGIIYEEAGRVLVPTSYYSTIYAALIINALGTEEQKKRYLSRIADGQLLSTVAYTEPDAFHNPDCFKTIAEKVGERWILSGVKSFVSNAHLADPLIVIARTENDEVDGGLSAFLVPTNSKGVTIKPLSTFGKDRQSIVELSGVELGVDNVLGMETEHAESAIKLAMKQATALQCLEMTGGSQKVIDMTVSYISERYQFGVPIGSFQAVQHHLANMSTSADGARLLAYQAVSLLSEDVEANREVSLAKAHASEAYKSITIMAHQLWGGMGYEMDSDLYLWSNRSKATELTFGSHDFHLKQASSYLSS